MRVELGTVQELAVIELCGVFCAHEFISDFISAGIAARPTGLPITRALDAILAALKAELIRRWRQEPGPACAIEMPIFRSTEVALIRDVLLSIKGDYLGRLKRAVAADSVLVSVITEALNVIESLIGALPASWASTQAVN